MTSLENLLPGGKGVWIPIDHGVSDYPVKGIDNLQKIITLLAGAGADAIVAHKGVISKYSSLYPGKMVAHLSVSTRHAGENSSDKVLVGTVNESVSRGAVGVSVQVNMGSESEPEMIQRLGEISTQAFDSKIPLLGMIYPRGKNLDVMAEDDTGGAAHAARLGFELGCDVVKTKWTGDAISFAKVCTAVPIPVLIAGGPAGSSDREILEIVYQAMGAGAAGVCFGRQVFTHAHPDKMVRALRAIVHSGSNVDQAIMDSGL